MNLDRAEGRVVIEHQRRIAAIAAQYRGRGVPREDLVQEGTIGFIKALRKFDPSRNAPLWGFAVVFVRDEIRDAIGRRFPTGLRSGQEEIPTDTLHETLIASETPESLYLAAESRHRLNECISRLPGLQRKVVELSMCASEVSPPEIARALDCSVSCVHDNRKRATDTLRERLGVCA